MNKSGNFLLLLAYLCLTSISVFGQNASFYKSSIILNTGSGNTYYDAGAATGNSDFNGNNLGIYSCTGTLILSGGEAEISKGGGCDVSSSKLAYRIYLLGSTSFPEFSEIDLPLSQDFGTCFSGNSCQSWAKTNAGVNLLSGLANGNYKIEAYFVGSTQFCTVGLFYDNNLNNNYSATFTISNPITITTNPSSSTVCFGSNTTLTASATGNDAFIWQKQNGASWTNVSNGSLVSGAPTTLNLTNVTTTEIYRCLFTNCGGINTLATQTVTVAPQRPTISLQPISQSDCDGNVIDFNITVSAGNTFIWQRKKPTDASYLTIAATTNSVITNTITTSQLKIRNIGNNENPHLAQYQCVVSDANSCINTTNVATLSVSSIRNIADSPTICERGTTSFTTTLIGTSTAIKWQKGTSETAAASYVDLVDSSPNIIGSGTTTLSLANIPLTDNNTFYRVKATFATVSNTGSGTCTQTQSVTAAITGKLTVIAAPTAPTANNASRCDVGTVILSATSTLGANESFRWYDSNVSSTVLGTNAIYKTESLAIGSYTYYLSVYNSSTTCESTRTAVVVLVNPLPTIALNSVADICNSVTTFSLPFSSITNSPNQYSISTGSPTLSGFSAISNASFGSSPINVVIPANASPDIYQFAISVKNSTTTCVSSNQSFTVKINSTPSAPIITTPVNFCQNVPTSALTATASGTNSLLWYGTSSVGGTLSLSAPIPSSNIVGTTTYYVSQLSTDNCESAKAAIDVIVNAIPVPPSAKTTITYCKNSAANMLSAVASGSNSLIWYDENDNILGSAPTPNTTIAGTQIFKVSQKSPLPTNCESAKTTILVTIYDLPIAPTVTTPVGYCQNAIATSLSATASGTNTLLWYGTNAIGGTSSGTAQTPITTSVGTTSYYVSQKDANNCESLRAKIDVEITPSVSVIITGINAFCITGMLNKSTTLSAKPTGGNGSYTYQWQNLAGNIFSATSQTYEVNSTVQVENSDTYSVTLTSGYCTATANVNVTKQGWSDVPSVSISPTGDICGSGSKTISVNSPNIGTYRWYSDATNLIQMVSGTSFSTPNLNSTTSYFVAREHQITTNLTCQTVRTLTTINVNPIPSAPTVTSDDDDNIVCAGAKVKLSVSDCAGTVVWSNGTSATTISVSASGTYNAICIVNGCKSLASSTQIIVVNQNPTITLGSISSICNASTTFDLPFTATSNSPGKYSLTSTMSGFVVISDASLTLSPISVVIPSGKTGNHSFTLSVKNSTTNCINSQTFNLTVLPVLLGGSLEISSSTVNCLGYNAGVISSVSVASGGKTTYAYQWQSSTDNQNFADITSENLTTYNPPALNQTTFYRRKVTDACGAEAMSSNVHQIQIVPDPQITITDVTDRIICSSGALNLQATVIGGSGTCTPTWQSSSSQSGTFANEQVGGLSFSATVTNTSSASIIKYYRAIYACSGTGSGSCNQSISSLVKVIINPNPIVPIVNGGGTICSGSSTTLSANGCNGTLQWSNGATTTSVSVSTAGSYSAVCTNSCGKSASSNEIVVNITTLASPILVGATTVCSGQSTILTATDCAGTVVWSDGGSGTSITVSPSTTTTYTAVCHTNGCISLNSEAVVVTVAPSIDFTIGSVADLCNSATSFVLPYNSTLGSPDKYSLTSTMAGFTSVIDASLGASPIIVSIPSGQAGTFGFTLTLKIGSTGCNKSQTFNVNILPALLGGSIETSSSTINCLGYNAGAITSISLASGGKSDYVYQWQSSTDNIYFTDISGANLTTYDPPALNQTTFYRRKVTDACGAEAISSNIRQIQIVPDPQITITDVTDRIICSSGALNLQATVIGGSGTCTPTWQSSSSPSGIFTNEQVGGLSFSATVTNTSSVSIIKYYRAIYACSGTGSGSCNQATSSLVKVIINPNPIVPIVNGGGTICSGSSTTLSANGCNGTLQWSNGATASSISVSIAGNYSAVCTNSCGTSVSSKEIVINITTLTSPILVGATTVCSGQSTILTATDCAGTIVWSDGGSGTSITVSPSTTTTYTAVCHTNGCISLNSEAVVVTVAPSIDFTIGSVADLCNSATSFVLPYNSTLGSPDKYSLTSTMAGFTSVIDASLGASPIIVSIPSGQAGTFGFTLTLKIGSTGCNKSQTFNVNILPALLGGSIETSSSTINCLGYNAGAITSISLASGGKSDYVYQWQSSTDNINFTDISGANLTTYDPLALNQTTFYRRKVTDACGAEAMSSNVHQIQIVPDPQITITDVTDRIICSSGALNLQATVIGGSGTCTPTWQSSSSPSGIFTNEQVGGLSFSATVTNTTIVSTTKYYRAIYACSGTGSGSCNQATSSLVKVIINPNPIVPIVNGGGTICSGSSTTLSANGCNGTLQWSNGATASSISVSIAGNYSAVCTNSCGMSVSSKEIVVNITTLTSPILVGATTVCSGQSTILTATDCAGTVVWSDGGSGTSITVSPITTTTYTAVCHLNGCTSMNSEAVVVTVAPSIDFTLGSVADLCNSATSFILPYNSTLGSPDKYSLTSTMAGFKGITDGILGSSPIFVVIPSGQTGTFGFTLTLKIGSTGCKKSQTFNVNILPALLGGSIETSSSTINCLGYNAGAIASISLASGGKSDYVYQWQSSTDNINFTDISGANLTTYDPPALNQTTFYRRKVTDACGAEAISSNIHQIQIVPYPQITITDVTDRIICSSGALNLQATVIGGSGTCTPTWQSSSSPSGIFTNEQVGGLSFSATVTNTTIVSITKYYRAIYACSGTGSGSCNQATSSLVKVIINPNPNTPTITPVSVIICPTQSTTLTASGCGGIVIWNVGQTGSTLSVSEAGTYSASCSLNSCLSAKSSSTTVTLSTGGIPVAPPVISGTAIICSGQATNLLASNCLGTVIWSNGVTANSISVNPSISTDYTAICFDGTCTSSNSNKITITVNSFPNITTQPKNEVDCNGNSVTFSVTASSVTSYQWQRKVPNGAFINIDNAISNTLKISNIGSSIDPNQTEYRVVLSNQSCSVTSTVAVLTVNSATGSLADQTICDGGNVSFNLANMFFSGSIQSYQWQRRVGISGTWNDIVGATTTTLIINDASNADEQYYRCKINLTASGSTCTRYTTEDDSNGAKLTVLVASTPTITGTNVICKGRDTKLTANNCDGIIAWSNGLSMASITVSPTINTSYTVSCTSAQCGFNVNSEPFIVSVNETLQPEIITYDVITPATLVFAARITVPNANLIWYNKSSGGIATTTSPSFTAVGTYSSWVTQTDPITGCESVRLPIIAKVLDYFHISQQPTNQVDCKGNSVFLGLVAVGPNPVFTYQWQRKRPNEPDFINLVEEGNGIRGWYARTMVVSNVGDVNNPDQTQYRCIVSNDGQFITSEISTLTVNSLEGSLPNLGICVGGNNEFNLQNFYNVKGNVVNYQWQTRPGTIGAWTNLIDGNGISGSNKSSLKFANATYEQGVFYRCLVKFNTQGFECTESTDDAKLIVSGFPPAPAVSSVFYCQNANAVRLKVDSPIQNLVWYSQETGGTGNTIAPIPNTNITGFLKYYVSDRTDEGCEGPRATINIEISATPTAPKNTTPISVNEGNILTFAAEGNSFENKVLRWYTSPTISTFSTTPPTFSAAGTYTRYVAQVSAFGCVGPRTVITATIIPNLKFTKQPLSQADCEGNLVTFSVSAIAPNIFTYQWQRQKPNDKNFIDLNGENANILKIANVGDGNNPNLSKYRCLIKDDRNTVISDEVTLTVNQIVGTMATMSLCEGKASKLSFSSQTITGNVVEYQWQKKIGGTYVDIPTNAIGVAIINEIGTYRGKITFIVDKNITCSRTTDDFKVEKKPTPTAPQAVNQNACLNAPFDVTKGVVANINSLLWYKSATDSTADNFTPKIDVTKIGKTTFYVSQINAFGCESERKSFDIMVSEIPEKPITNDLSYCRNAPSLTLVATTSPQNEVLWYASQTAKEAFAQTPKPSTKLDGEVTYFAATKNIAGCESERALLKVLVAPCIANFESNFNNCLQVSADSVKGNQWFDLYDKTGRLYASVNSNGQNLGKVSISIRHYGRGSAAIPQTQNDTKLMSRYADFQSSLINEFDKPVSLRIYYLNDELNEYKTATNLQNLTINDFNIVHYNGISEDCGFENNDNFAAGESSVIYKNVKGNQIAKDFFYLQFDVNEFSENGATANNFAEIILSGKETENQTVQLNWQSKYEIKAEKYIVERSFDCKNFTKISEVKANGTGSVYENIDFQPLSDKSCYRLVYIDKDGIKKYLDAIEVNFTDKDPVCSVFTNHWAKGDEINLYLRNIKEKEIKLFDMRGQKFPFSIIKNEAQIIKIRPDIHLSKGIHFVVVIGEDGKKCVQKVVVNP